mgnify:CR=1 FL=1
MTIMLMLILMGVGFGVPLSYHLMVNGVIINIVGFFGIIANLLIMRVSSQQQMRSSINIIICGKTYRIDASTNMCYYSENQLFCFLKS